MRKIAEFFWVLNPPAGACVVCGASVNDRGFVDFIGDTLVFNRDSGDFTGVVDIYICASCVEQASQRVGCASRDQVDSFAYREVALQEENEKLKDEVQAWTQRYERLNEMLKTHLDLPEEVQVKTRTPEEAPTK